MDDRTRIARATIDDVAARAGVSIKTVSRVVNHEPNVRPATRERVEVAIRELAYRPNTAARRLAGTRSFLFALVYDDPSSVKNASANYFMSLQGGALAKAREAGYDLLIHPCDCHSASIVDEMHTLCEHTRIDGLLLAPPLAEVKAIVRTLRDLGRPVVRISPGRERDPDAVHTNDRQAAMEMTTHLAELGHERIAFIRGHPDHRAMGNRELGYRDGLRAAGLGYRSSLVLQGDNSYESGMACARRLLGRKRPPTAIFACNDDMAAGVMRVAQEMGISVPDDLSLAGFDDVPLSRQLWPPLTTVHQPVYEMAVEATSLLFQRIAGEPSGAARRVDSSLVIRQSTGPVPT